jgi:L-rhamnose mutarotase
MRVALHTTVRGDRIAEYERAHAAVPVELADAIRAAGVTAGGDAALPVVWQL